MLSRGKRAEYAIAAAAWQQAGGNNTRNAWTRPTPRDPILLTQRPRRWRQQLEYALPASADISEIESQALATDATYDDLHALLARWAV
jgi:hypothetical protein